MCSASCANDAPEGLAAADSGSETPVEVNSPHWEELIAYGWELAPDTETNLCVRETLTEDVVLSGYKPMVPSGTHHTTLSIGTPKEPDGVEICSGFEAHAAVVWATGVRTDAFEFPDGIGMVLPAGQQLLLNLHLYNTRGEPVRGHSGLAVRARERSEITRVADATLMGPVEFSIAPGAPVKIAGGCTFAAPATVFTVAAHMHRLGRHARIVAERKDHPELVLHDGPFNFGEQPFYPVGEVPFAAGDRINIECTFENDTDRVVSFGESTTTEMCFAVVARYPAANQNACVF